MCPLVPNYIKFQMLSWYISCQKAFKLERLSSTQVFSVVQETLVLSISCLIANICYKGIELETFFKNIYVLYIVAGLLSNIEVPDLEEKFGFWFRYGHQFLMHLCQNLGFKHNVDIQNLEHEFKKPITISKSISEIWTHIKFL